MYRCEFQGNGANSSFGETSLDTNTRLTAQKPCITGGSKKSPSEPDFGSDVSPFVNEPVSSAMEKNELAHQIAESTQNIAGSPSETTTSFCHLNDDSYPSKTLDTETDAFTSRDSSQCRPTPFTEFALKLSDLPLTKEKIVESLSLEEGSGFLQNIMKSGRRDLRIGELSLDHTLENLLMSILNAKNMCVLMEDVPTDEPEDINSARVQTEQLMGLISASFLVFEDIHNCGKALTEGLQEYSKKLDDFHPSLNLLLDYLLEQIKEKCVSTEMHA